MKKSLLIIFFFFLYTSFAYAYIDPFTGAFLIKAILATFTTIIFYLGYPFRVIKKLYSKMKKKMKNEK